ncbi:43236_t:CDS:2 [Gigaspora margarita]|uniref:43236_t:CDS:1 n=1 Tax=Gigaspora margarita TaxID=4874 RepID=A0ABN7WGF8_GIGMA|nr:43236_t:CDS:2 [Gigaspora margarita]
MDKISCPSKWAKEWTKDSKQKDGILFRNHRPTNASDIPIQFYRQIFETFINFIWDCQLSDRERKLVLELASVMSGVFSDESQRADAFRCWLELFFDDEIEIQSAESNESSRIGERKIYGIIYPKIGRYRVLLANLEVKLEPGMNGDCYIQNDAYYKEFVIKSHMQDSEFYNKTCLPAFLIDLDGPNLSISGAVCVPFIICDRLTDILPLDRITYNHAKADDIARVFLALKNSIHILKDYYSSVYESREAICTTSPWFPCINEINLEEGTVTIKYKKRHSIHRNLWIVEIQTENTQEMGLVKFTQTYYKEAHGTCLELGLAPKLWAVNNLQQGWKIVVMEYLEEYKPLHTFNSEIFSKTESVVKNATKSFHDSGYVHGDLRDENIMVKYKYGKIDIKFVDFDWAGREGEAMYPESLNPAINWHVDVGWHKLIKREHDHHLVDNIYDMSDDKPSKKRWRLSEWMS